MPREVQRRRKGELIDERFFKEEDRGFVSPCWIWQRALSSTGYGSVYCFDRKTRISAHVAVYQERVGPIPVGLEIDHLCRVRACVNPQHLEPVTKMINTRRGRAAKLNPEAYDEIVEEFRNGASKRGLAARYGLRRSGIQYLIKRAVQNGQLEGATSGT